MNYIGYLGSVIATVLTAAWPAAKLTFFAMLWLGLLAVFVGYSTYFWKHITTAAAPPRVKVGSFKVGSEPPEQVSAYLIARATEIASPIPLELLHEVKVPAVENNFGAPDKSFFEGVKFDIQGVDVPAVLRLASAVIPSDQHVVSGFMTFDASTPVLHLEWRPPDDTKKKSWLLTLDRAVDSKVATKLLLDQALYRLYYYMNFDRDGPKEWRKVKQGVQPQLEGTTLPEFPSEQALEAYYAGRQHLQAYLQLVSADDLEQAEKKFRVLRKEMPRFADGLMLLGVTLSELRDETEAISVYNEAISVLEPAENELTKAEGALAKAESEFRQAEQELQIAKGARTGAVGPGTQQLKKVEEDKQVAFDQARRALDTIREDFLKADKLHLSEQKKLLQARLFRATAERKLFHWRHNHEALKILLGIEERITAVRGVAAGQGRSRLSDSDARDFAKIRFAVLAEKSHNLSHYLAFLNLPNFERALNERAPELVQLPKNARDELEKPGSKPEQRHKVFVPTMERLHKLHIDALSEANKQLENLYGTDPHSWPLEARNYSYQLKHAQGDGIYRRAQLIDQTPKEFEDHCKDAIELLKQADAARPNHYAVYQSLARIYADARYDPRGDHIDSARELYSRSIELKPGDFFGYQQLAFLAVREAYLWGPEFLTSARLKSALEHAEKARQLRPGSSYSFIALAQLYALRWAHSAPKARTRDAELVEASLLAAERVNQFPERVAVPVTLAKLQWGYLQLRAVADDQFDEIKARVQGDIKHAAEVGESWSWETQRLRKIATNLSEGLAQTTSQNRKPIRWPKAEWSRGASE